MRRIRSFDKHYKCGVYDAKQVKGLVDSDWVIFPINRERYCVYVIDKHFQNVQLPADRINRTLPDGRVITKFGGYSYSDFPNDWHMNIMPDDDVPDLIRFWAERIYK